MCVCVCGGGVCVFQYGVNLVSKEIRKLEKDRGEEIYLKHAYAFSSTKLTNYFFKEKLTLYVYIHIYCIYYCVGM